MHNAVTALYLTKCKYPFAALPPPFDRKILPIATHMQSQLSIFYVVALRICKAFGVVVVVAVDVDAVVVIVVFQ